MTMNADKSMPLLAVDSKALHEEFLVWFADNRLRFELAHPGMDTWMLELTAWSEFKKWKGIQ